MKYLKHKNIRLFLFRPGLAKQTHCYPLIGCHEVVVKK